MKRGDDEVTVGWRRGNDRRTCRRNRLPVGVRHPARGKSGGGDGGGGGGGARRQCLTIDDRLGTRHSRGH